LQLSGNTILITGGGSPWAGPWTSRCSPPWRGSRWRAGGTCGGCSNRSAARPHLLGVSGQMSPRTSRTKSTPTIAHKIARWRAVWESSDEVARPPPIAIPKSPTPNMARARDEFVPMCIPSSRGRESLQWNHTTHPRPRAGPAITGQPAAVLAWDWRADKASKVGLSRSRALRQGCRRLERMLAQGPFMITSETGIRVPRPLRLPTPEYPKPTVSRPDHSKSIWFRNRVGALLGTALAWLVFDGREMWVWGSFRLHVSANLWTLGLLWTLVTSLVGGLTPALRAARLPASEALRAA
jgi:hypothetical protein